MVRDEETKDKDAVLKEVIRHFSKELLEDSADGMTDDSEANDGGCVVASDYYNGKDEDPDYNTRVFGEDYGSVFKAYEEEGEEYKGFNDIGCHEEHYSFW